LNWTKHDGSIESPVPKDTPIEVETWTSQGNIFAKASELNWKAVKYYRVAEPKKPLNGTQITLDL